MLRGPCSALLAQRRFSSPAAAYVRRVVPPSRPNGRGLAAAVQWRNALAVPRRGSLKGPVSHGNAGVSARAPRVFSLLPASSRLVKAVAWLQGTSHALVPALPTSAAGENGEPETDASHQSRTTLSEEQLAASLATEAAAGSNPASESVPALAMTREQRLVCDLACEGASLFIGGDAGTGKSFLLRAIAARMTAAGRRVAVTASTGIAALNIGGNTFHSTFGVPLPTPDDTVDRSSRSRAAQEGDGDGVADVEGAERGGAERAGDADDAEGDDAAEEDVSPLLRAKAPHRLRFTNTGVLADVDVVIIDEVSMLHAGVLESFDRAARRMPGRDATRPFGGLQMILSGDFLQLTPFAAGDAPFGGRRHRLQQQADALGGAQRGKSGQDTDRVVCERVGPENEDLDAPPDNEPRPSIAETTATAVTPCQKALRRHRKSRAALPSADAPSSSSSASAAPRHRRDVWYYDKPMFESWCFSHHLLHVQLREPQRQQDRTFAAALNRLRQGQLPYRISRSAVMNPVAEDAVRLLPTKAAVKNFNDRKLLQLDGDEHVFATQLTTSELTCAPAPNVAKGDAAGVCGGSGGSDSCDAMLLVYYQLSCATGSARVGVTLRGRLRIAEAVTVARALEEVCLLPRGSVQVHGLPSPVSYSSSLCTACVRCVGPTRPIAEGRRAAVQAVLDRWPGAKGGGGGSAVPAPGGGPKPRPYPLAPLFPRDVVRLEAIEGRQLLRRLQPFMRESLREAVRRDTVLQHTRLKIGCRVMLLRNLTQQYVNGSLGTVVAFRPAADCVHLVPDDLKAAATPPHLLTRTVPRAKGDGKDDAVSAKGAAAAAVEVPVVRMDVDGKEVAIPWITVPVPVAKQDWHFTLRAACVPLTPAYAFTVHKIQGVTLDHPVLFDADGMFPCDHLVYVAASRVRTFEHLRIINLTPRMISVHKPSLLFTQRIPSVDAAVRTWRTWQKKKGPGPLLFYPSYVKPQCWLTKTGL